MNIFKPTWKKIIIFLVLAFALGGIVGLFLYIGGTCWFGNPCAAYSPIKIFFAYLFSWPILVMQKILVGDSNNFDKVLFKDFGWLALLVYYYLIVSIFIHINNKKK